MYSPIAFRVRPLARVVRIAANFASITAELTVPAEARGMIVFARTNAATRQTRYDYELVQDLVDVGLGTLVFDLLTPAEELVDAPTRGLRSDVALLSRRLIEAIDWLADRPETAGLDVGVIGEGSSAAAAFVAACVRPRRVSAIVSYAPRLDLATPVLPRVKAPSLLIVEGEGDDDVRSNDRAFKQLTCHKELVRIAADRVSAADDVDKEVSHLALDWFSRVMAPALA